MPESLTRQFPVSRNQKPIDILPPSVRRVFDFHWNFKTAREWNWYWDGDGALVLGVRGPTGDFTALGFV